jgi:hypothetical protein
MPLRQAALLGALATALVAGFDEAAASTLIRTPHPIAHLAQDGRRVAWALACGGEVQIHNLRTGETRTVSKLHCGDDGVPFVDGLALGGRRALWRALFDFPCANFIGKVYTATPSSAQRRFETHTFCATFMADGDGGTLIYSRTDPFGFGDGHTYRVTKSGKRMRLPGVAPTRRLAASEGRLALLPLGGGNSVEIRDGTTGALLSSFTPTDKVRSLALGATRAAVLLRDAVGARRIEWYDLNGTLLGSANVRDDARGLDMAGPRVVYRTGRIIRLLDIRSEEQTVVARPARKPIDLSIERRRVAWAQNKAGEGRIKRVIVPAG